MRTVFFDVAGNGARTDDRLRKSNITGFIINGLIYRVHL